ncbi:MAG: class I tRNA ligase family protein [Patescibacteria group bacterium]
MSSLNRKKITEYQPQKIEKKWQKEWEKKKLFQARGPGKRARKKFYPLIEFPYPSGDGLHVGHPRPYIGMDIIARKRRMEGFDVLFPIGWDAFGLPTENYAVKTGVHPKVVTKKNTDTFRRQIQSLGISFDWSREINTTDPAYYKWTQWIFLKFFEQGLAYKSKMPINWCPSCKIGLANEEAIGGICERCEGFTEKREKEQWMLEITKYADRLDRDLDTVDYLPKIIAQQRNWIGRSEGALISFTIENALKQNVGEIEVFTTRPDTLFGATYLVLAPEHKALEKYRHEITNFPEVGSYALLGQKKDERERTDTSREKTGVEMKGLKATNPATGEHIPLFVADYVLFQYGTGSIMAVPAHDERDFEFAKKFNLPVRNVVNPYFEHPDARRKGQREKKKKIILVVEYQGKYLSIHWKPELGGRLFLGGTVEEGEENKKTALRELKEETGYIDAEIEEVAEEKFFYDYYAYSKEKAFSAEISFLYAHLKSLKKIEPTLEEKERGNFTVEWVLPEVAKKEILNPPHQRAYEIFIGKGVYVGGGFLSNSGRFDGLSTEEGGKKIMALVGGKTKTIYKLRDWVFSRQRYWGEPIPLVFCEHCAERMKNKEVRNKDLTKGEQRNPGWIPLREKDLPLKLPEVKNFKPTNDGQSPLSSIKKWREVKCPQCGGKAIRETDTMPNWAGSSWYFLRYTDPKNKKEFASKKALSYFTPVDWYNGGMEHTTLHVLYSRFWHKFLYDLKLVPTLEPYLKRTSHGLILAEGGVKMSKSKGNVVNPDAIVGRLGADTLRAYEMFMGPFDQAIAWNEESVAGVRRFLERVWKLSLLSKKTKPSKDLERLLHQTIKKVSEDIEDMKFNTAMSAFMILSNALEKEEVISQEIVLIFLRLLSPFVPHIAEELAHRLGEKTSLQKLPWPKFDSKKLVQKDATIAVQVNGKVRATITLPSSLSPKEVQKRALLLPQIKKWMEGKTVKKVIFVPGKVLNLLSFEEVLPKR